MKKLLMAISIILIFAMQAVAADGMINVQSDFNVKETTDRLESILNKKGMTIFNRIKHSESAGKVGIELRETELIIFGNPKVGSPLMKCQQSTAIDLPQKALVWEDENGQVWLSYNAPDYLAQRHDLAGCGEVVDKIRNALANFAKAATQP